MPTVGREEVIAPKLSVEIWRVGGDESASRKQDVWPERMLDAAGDANGFGPAEKVGEANWMLGGTWRESLVVLSRCAKERRPDERSEMGKCAATV
jgi:hypothetical protein